MMNTDPELLPEHCDVLIIGAGPAGSAAAITLAKAGRHVVLIDQHAFPRDKICGDGLIPDAHQALAKLGVLDEVMQQAHQSRFLSCTSPRGLHVDIEGSLAVLPRKELDAIVCKAAVLAGARMFAPLRFTQLIEENGCVVGAQLSHGDHKKALRAPWVILATGAVPAALTAAQMTLRQGPSAVAMRCYIQNQAMAEKITKLEVIFHQSLSPGYGWIFPCGKGVFNIGVGVFNTGGGLFGQKASARSPIADTNLHDMFNQLCSLSESAKQLVEGGQQLGPLKGAPLRCTLEGATLSRPGLLVTGEAAGSTYALTGEGIGKALETGMHAAEAILHSPDKDQVRALYQSHIDALRPRFQLYERAQLFSLYPWLADLVIWRAQKSDRLRQRISGLLNETSNPGQLFTLKGLLRLFS
jgi:geranylgeranyl reductase family protein